MAKCDKCTVIIEDDSDKLICKGNCSKQFHVNCVETFGEASQIFTRERKSKWICQECDIASKTLSNSKIQNEAEIDQVSNIEIKQLIEKFNLENAAFKIDFIKNLRELQQAVEFNSSLLTDAINSNKKLHEELNAIKKQNSALTEENRNLQTKVGELQSDIIELQQYSRRCNIEINNLPESPKENLREVITEIMKKAEVDLGKDITALHRIPTVKKEKIKPVILQFNTVESKNVFLSAVKVKRFTAKDINPEFENIPVFFNEHLCPEIKKLLYECKKFKKEQEFRFCWTKGGKIFLRKNESSRVYRIKQIHDLKNVQQ